MGDKSKIDWTQATWNPMTGCSKISKGCKFCYAERMARRLQAAGTKGYEHGFQPFIHYDRMEVPVRWTRPRKVFVCSMGDLFHEQVPFDFIAAVFGVMARADQHQFQVLTKRPERMKAFFDQIMADNTPALDCSFELLRHEALHGIAGSCGPFHTKWGVANEAPWPLPNVWIGVTAEEQRTADERIPILVDIPAAVRFVSVEPMLSMIDLRIAAFNGADSFETIPGIDWVICGCESGAKADARRTPWDWVRVLRDQCEAASIPFFLKQLRDHEGKLQKMPTLDGIVWNEMPERGNNA